jgi:hypothetical protein
MMKSVLAGAAMAALIALNPSAVFAADAVGKASEVEGAITLTHGGSSAALKDGAAIAEGDTLETTDKSRTRIVFDDKTDLVVAGKGKVKIDSYVYDPKNAGNDNAHLSLLGVAFSYVGGLLDKGKDPKVKLDLDFGSIGIRGTKIYRAMNHMECWIYVERGKVDVSNKGGSVHLKDGQGTIMSASDKAPAAAHIWSDKDVAWLKSQVADPRLHKKDWK